MNLLSRVVIAIIVGLVTAFVFYVVGALLAPVTTLGGILEGVSYIAGVLAGLLYFFRGSISGQPLV